jgi:hypothetical protein
MISIGVGCPSREHRAEMLTRHFICIITIDGEAPASRALTPATNSSSPLEQPDRQADGENCSQYRQRYPSIADLIGNLCWEQGGEAEYSQPDTVNVIMPD